MRRGDMPPADLSGLAGRRVLIALSGGADSVALTAMLCEARAALGLTLFAAHLDHGIRPESADDAEWCRRLCAGLDIPFVAERIDVPALAAQTGEGLETVARRVRHAFLRRQREALGAEVIALAHHMDALARPLLGLRKREILAYLDRRGLTWREDATNAVDDNPRNALRLHGIPALERAYPGFVPAAARYAQSARIESDYVAGQAKLWMDGRLREGPFFQVLGLEPPVPEALLRRAIRAPCGTALPWDRLNALAALAGADRGRLQVSPALTAERGRRGLYFLRETPPPIPEAPLSLNGKTRLEGLCEIEAACAEAVPVRGDPWRQALDADALAGAVVRARRAGDRIRPLCCGDRLLSDYMTDKKLDRPLRDCLPLVAKGERVLWACGLGISEDAKLTGRTRRAVALRCRHAYENLF